MLADIHNGGSDTPNTEERYSSAVNASDLTLREERRGPADLLVAAGLSAKGDAANKGPRALDKPSIALGGALARLQAEWHSVEKPQRHMPKSIRQWIEDLPLVKTGERLVKGTPHPIMTRDKEGARQKHDEERSRLEALYEQELKFLAQKLPSRYWVRTRLFTIAVYWNLSEPDRIVAEVLRYWLQDTCPTCHGTGEIIVSEKVLTCPDCEGRKTSQVPSAEEGRRLYRLMEESKHAWAQTVTATARRMRAAR